MVVTRHSGLLVLARTAQARKGGAPIPEAATLAAKENDTLGRLNAMLVKNYGDAFASQAMPADHAMADALSSKTGKAYDRLFFQSVITQHQQTQAMIDEYLPKAKVALIKQIAETLKADRAREIGELQTKIAALGS